VSGTVATAALFLSLVVLAYLPALRGSFLWDDNAHVTSPQLRSLHGLWRIWFEPGATQQYYPLLHSAFWLEHLVWGDSVVGYHLVNVVLHAAAAFLVTRILRGVGFPAPVLAGSLFALHPVCVESVAWISEQKNTLSAVLYLSSACLYLRFDATRRRSLFTWALGLYVMALLTKSVTATLPGALLVVLWWQRGRLGWKRDVLPLLPWFAIGAASGLFTAWMEAKFIGAEGADFSFTFAERLLLAGRVVVFYARSLAWPANLMFVYPRWSPSADLAVNGVCLAVCLLVLASLALLARRSRGPIAGFLFFCGTLFPALGFFNVYPFRFSFVADHFQYLASLGLLVPAAWGLHVLARSLATGRPARCLMLGIVPALLFVLTSLQAGVYRDSETLYRSSLARNPSAWLLHYNLGVTLGLGPEHIQESIREYEETVRLKPDHWEAHNNLASALRKMSGRNREAIEHYRLALRYRPDYAEANNNLGIALEEEPGGIQEAELRLRAAIRILPEYDAAHCNLGVLLMRQPGRLDESIRELREAVRIRPEMPDYHYDLGNALALEPGRIEDAIGEYREAVRLKPDYVAAHSNLGVALAHTPGGLGEAIKEYQIAAKLEPGSGEIHANLANALAKIPDRQGEAISEYKAALAADPSDARFHYGLALLLSRTPAGLPEARIEFEEALRLNPQYAEAHFGLGIILAMSGQRPDAERHLEQAIAIRPDFQLARNALARLRAGGR
jgi:tetratricopeptide (TPR) repeat protein